MRSVLITRPQPVADEFAEKLRRDGYTAYVAPMMEYVSVAADLADLAPYQAVVFTSAQAIQAFAGLSRERNIPVLAVGDATASTALRAGFKQVYSAKGNSVDVASLIRGEASKLGLKNVLHLCSADTPDDIGAAVKGLGVAVERLPIYKAQLVSDIPEDVTAAMRRGAVDVVLVFSTRTAENLTRLMVKRDLRSASAKMEIICISDQVARAVRELPWRLVRVARQPRLEAVMDVLREQGSQSRVTAGERRARIDRRQLPPPRDEQGLIRAETYKGPDRRIVERRAHEQKQQIKVWREKVRFMNRTMLTAAFMFIAIVLAGVFLMAPEYAALDKHPPWMESLNQRLRSASGTGTGAATLSGRLNSAIANIRGSGAPAAAVVQDIASSAARALTSPGDTNFAKMLSDIEALRQRAGGAEAMDKAVATLRGLLLTPGLNKEEDISRSVEAASAKDPALGAMLSSAKKEDYAAAALLLVLNEFRSNVDGQRPYKEDLALLKKFSGDDPYMNRAIQRLAPYAESGVISRDALQAELKGLAGDIVTAGVQGKDVSVKAAAEKRVEKLLLAGSASKVEGASPEAVVARAQIYLDQGDVKAAMRELQRLDGPSADIARPWMGGASQYVTADGAADDLARGLMEGVAKNGPLSLQKLIDGIKNAVEGTSAPYVSPALRGGAAGGGVIAPKN